MPTFGVCSSGSATGASIDLIGAVGYYCLVSMVLNVDRVPVPAGETRRFRRSPIDRRPAGRNAAMARSGLFASIAIAALWLVQPAAAHVVGERHFVADEASAALRDAKHRSGLRITAWYPAAGSAKAAPIDIGPPGRALFRVGDVAADAAFTADAPGRLRPVILLSHGFGSAARMMGWFGTRLAQDGYVVISVDHPGNNAIDPMTVPGAILWWERAEDLKLALQVVGKDANLGPHLDLAAVGAAGFSAGGFTALLLGGGRADPAHFMAFCRENPQDGVCRPQVEFTVTKADLDQALKDPDVAGAQAHAGDDHSVASVKAVFAMAPALVQAIEPHSLEAIGRPVSIVAGDADVVAPPATNAQVAARLIPGARLELVHGAGHYAFLSTCTAAGMAAAKVCAQAAPQEEAHRVAILRAAELFSRTLPGAQDGAQ